MLIIVETCFVEVHYDSLLLDMFEISIMTSLSIYFP